MSQTGTSTGKKRRKLNIANQVYCPRCAKVVARINVYQGWIYAHGKAILQRDMCLECYCETKPEGYNPLRRT